MNEFDRIAAYFAPLASSPGAAGLKDDVAELSEAPAHSTLVATVDALVEHIHFLPSDPIDSVARKLVRVNVSDILSKGAKPTEALLTLGWPEARPEDDLATFADALGNELKKWGIHLVGGDTVNVPKSLFLSLTLMGHSPGASPIRRSGARVGDIIWVTGEIGWGAIGLEAALQDGAVDAIERYRVPEVPPLGMAEILSAHATGTMDISDGLLADLGKLAEASEVAAHIEASTVPLARSAGDFDKAISQLAGGDDYQFLFTTAPEARDMIRQACAEIGVSVTEIGHVTDGHGVHVTWRGIQQSLPHRLGFAHGEANG
ncbi:MAG: thiamine-phosphate kinase [Pseudomonadota bacterium]